MRRIVMSLFLMGISSAVADEMPIRPGQLYGSAFVCPVSVAPDNCNGTSAREVIKVTCGGRGHAMGIAQMASNESGQSLQENEYIKIECRVGRVLEERAEKR